MNETDKKCGFFKSILRYNASLIAEIAGPATGLPGLRARRISIVKGKLTMWERGFNDITFEKGEMTYCRTFAYNYPCLAAGAIYYGTYVDVLMDGSINRVLIRTASVQRDAVHSKNPFPGGIPVVSGWVKCGTKEKDSHFDDPMCPNGYEPLIVEYVKADFLDPNYKLKELGIDGQNIENRQYLMKDPLIFDKIETPTADEQANLNLTNKQDDSFEHQAQDDANVKDPKYQELVELKKLCDSGIISKKEFEKKKNDILFDKKEKNVDKNKRLKTWQILLSSIGLITYLVGLVFGLFVEYIHMKERLTLLEALDPSKGASVAISIFIFAILTLVLASLNIVFTIKPHKKKIVNIIVSALAVLCCTFVVPVTWVAWAKQQEIWAYGIKMLAIMSSVSLLFLLIVLPLIAIRKEKQ